MNLSEIIEIKKSNDGSYELARHPISETNIYQYLKNNGFGKSKINGRIIFFRQIDTKIIETTFEEMKIFFRQALSKISDKELAKGIRKNDIQEWYLKKQ